MYNYMHRINTYIKCRFSSTPHITKRSNITLNEKTYLTSYLSAVAGELPVVFCLPLFQCHPSPPVVLVHPVIPKRKICRCNHITLVVFLKVNNCWDILLFRPFHLLRHFLQRIRANPRSKVHKFQEQIM
jgi:hypothetical protein